MWVTTLPNGRFVATNRRDHNLAGETNGFGLCEKQMQVLRLAQDDIRFLSLRMAGYRGLLRMAAELELDDAEHFAFRRGLAGPDFELAGTLLHEHFQAADDGETA